MRAFHRRPAAAAVVLTAALFSLAACSSDSEPTASASPRPPAASRGAADALDEAEATPTPSAGASKKGAVLPDPKLTPATGSFTSAQKKFLSGRVPADMDPAAVLQTGQESCQRLERTAKRDRDAAIGAIIAGEIPDAEAATTHLCKAQKPLVTAAAKGFPDGTEKKPAAGTYRALTTNSACTWRALGSGGKVLASGPTTGATGKITAKVPAGTREFVSTGCYAWLPA